MPIETKTYTNRRHVPMELTEIRGGLRRFPSANTDPLHTYPLKPGESIELNIRHGVRRVWRKA